MTMPQVNLWLPTLDGAIFSADRLYRYTLNRELNDKGPVVAFIGLNPSTADETTNDKTINRCIGFVRRWKGSRLVMLNLFAYRSTDPLKLWDVVDPIGPDNDAHILRECKNANMVIAAFGAWPAAIPRGKQVRKMLHDSDIGLQVLGFTASGTEPRHPLFMKRDTIPQLWPYS